MAASTACWLAARKALPSGVMVYCFLPPCSATVAWPELEVLRAEVLALEARVSALARARAAHRAADAAAAD